MAFKITLCTVKDVEDASDSFYFFKKKKHSVFALNVQDFEKKLDILRKHADLGENGNGKVTEIKFGSDDLSDDTFARVLGAIGRLDMQHLRVFDSGRNYIGRDSVEVVAAMLDRFINLHNVCLRCRRNIPTASWDLTLRAMINSVHLQRLDLSYSSIHLQGAETIANIIHSHKSLEYLSLNDCNIGDEGAPSIVSAIRSSGSLAHISLAENGFSSHATAVMLADAIKQNNVVSYLNLQHNRFGAADFDILIEAAKSNFSLDRYSLSLDDARRRRLDSYLWVNKKAKDAVKAGSDFSLILGNLADTMLEASLGDKGDVSLSVIFETLKKVAGLIRSKNPKETPKETQQKTHSRALGTSARIKSRRKRALSWTAKPPAKQSKMTAKPPAKQSMISTWWKSLTVESTSFSYKVEDGTLIIEGFPSDQKFTKVTVRQLASAGDAVEERHFNLA